MADVRQRRLLAGTILIVVGLLSYLNPRIDILRTEYLLVGLGAIFIVAYFVMRKYGLLIPGCILSGLGLGVTFDHSLRNVGDGPQLGLGLGFIAIYLIGFLLERRRQWWPLVPGTVLVLSGFDLTEDAAAYFFDHWELMLVVIGVLLVLGSLRGSKSKGVGGGTGKSIGPT